MGRAILLTVFYILLVFFGGVFTGVNILTNEKISAGLSNVKFFENKTYNCVEVH